ncbi:MAG: polysaccharide export protein [Acidobacteriota bacterium]|nr:polysaccharide export protein [Acidobacteriota bacterium]
MLGPEDQISIHVVDLDDVSDKPVRIDPSGFIDLPLIGRVQAGGLSVEQLRDVLAVNLAKYIESPRITINVLEYRSQPVSILGEVNTPGVHQLQGPKNLIDIISLAGGLKPDAGDKLTITRELKWGVLPVSGARSDLSGRFSVADIPLASLTAGHDPAANIAVYPNDVISVGRAAVVYVIGEVKKAGGFSLESRDDISLLRALSLAEGMTHEAAPRKAKILRASNEPQAQAQETAVDVDKILAGKAPDVHLRADDILFIPNSVSGSAMKRAVEAAVQIATGVVIFRP